MAADTADIMQTMKVGLEVGIPATLFVITSNVALNQTGLDRGQKTAATTITGVVATAALAGYAPRIAAGIMVGTVVNAGVQLAQATKLEAKVDAYFAQLPAPNQQQQQQQGATPGNTGTPGQLPAQQSGGRVGYVQYGNPQAVLRAA